MTEVVFVVVVIWVLSVLSCNPGSSHHFCILLILILISGATFSDMWRIMRVASSAYLYKAQSSDENWKSLRKYLEEHGRQNCSLRYRRWNKMFFYCGYYEFFVCYDLSFDFNIYFLIAKYNLDCEFLYLIYLCRLGWVAIFFLEFFFTLWIW